jgi:hypothetical protein
MASVCQASVRPLLTWWRFWSFLRNCSGVAIHTAVSKTVLSQYYPLYEQAIEHGGESPRANVYFRIRSRNEAAEVVIFRVFGSGSTVASQRSFIYATLHSNCIDEMSRPMTGRRAAHQSLF